LIVNYILNYSYFILTKKNLFNLQNMSYRKQKINTYIIGKFDANRVKPNTIIGIIDTYSLWRPSNVQTVQSLCGNDTRENKEETGSICFLLFIIG